MASNKKTSTTTKKNKRTESVSPKYKIVAGKASKNHCAEKRKQDSDRCQDFTNDHVISPPKDKKK